MKTFKDFLEEVKESVPGIPYRDAQSKASDLYQKYKAEVTPDPGNKKENKQEASKEKVGVIDIPRCNVIEKEIRENTVDVNRIQMILRRNNIHDYNILEFGKEGANTKVCVEALGIRIPVTGYFLCFIAR